VSPLNRFSPRPILCYVTDRKSLTPATGESQREALLKRIEAAAKAGVDWIQIREKDLSGREIFDLVLQVISQVKKKLGANCRTKLIVNDRFDVAISAQAHGVHLGEHSVAVAEIRRWLTAHSNRNEREILIGASCHSLDNCKAAEQSGADYIFFGPIFPSPSKAAYGSPQGIKALADVCRVVNVPVLAIGGITLENGYLCINAGAEGLAAIRLFQHSDYLVSLEKLRSMS
jgi:thiamine-phosphate pyrophosphorylase